MAELKLTIHQLKQYLGNDLKVMIKNRIVTLDTLTKYSAQTYPSVHGFTFCSYKDLKPICYQLSDLVKFIPELGFVPAKRLFPHHKECEYKVSGNELIMLNPKTKNSFGEIYLNLENLTFYNAHMLFKWNFWVFNQDYFEKGLVIDKLALEGSKDGQ